MTDGSEAFEAADPSAIIITSSSSPEGEDPSLVRAAASFTVDVAASGGGEGASFEAPTATSDCGGGGDGDVCQSRPGGDGVDGSGGGGAMPPPAFSSVVIVDWQFLSPGDEIMGPRGEELPATDEAAGDGGNGDGGRHQDGDRLGLDPERPCDSWNANVIEFSWCIFDCESLQMSDSEQRYVTPFRRVLSSETDHALLQKANIKPAAYEASARPLEEVVSEFQSVLSARQSAAGDGRSIAVAVYDNLRRRRFCADCQRRSLPAATVASCFSEVILVSDLLADFYPQLKNDQIRQPHLAMQRLFARLPHHQQHVGNEPLAGLRLCVALIEIFKKIAHDGMAATYENTSRVNVQHEVADQRKLDIREKGGKRLRTEPGRVSGRSVIRLRGLPWEITEEQIVKFAKPVATEMTTADVFLASESGTSGQGYMIVDSEEIRDRCIENLHKKCIGKRWIELFRSTEEELHRHIAVSSKVTKSNESDGSGGGGGRGRSVGRGGEPSSGGEAESHGVLRLRGLPWSSNQNDLERFFADHGHKIDPSKVTLGQTKDGRQSGDAWVVMPSLEAADAARRDTHRKLIGRRYIEVFPSTMREAESARRGIATSVSRNSRYATAGPYQQSSYQQLHSHSGGSHHGGGGGSSTSSSSPYYNDARPPRGGGLGGGGSSRGMNGGSGGQWFSGGGGCGGDFRGGGGGSMQHSMRGVHHIGAGSSSGGGGGGSMGRGSVGGGGGGMVDGGGAARDGWVSRGSYGSGEGYRGGGRDGGGRDGGGGRRDIAGGGGSGGNRRVMVGGGGDAPSFEYGFTVLRLRGLPYNATETHIIDFFQGFGMSAILPATVPVDGRPSGEAYVNFVDSQEAWGAARARNGCKMDHRYIELFPATKEEMQLAAAGCDPREIRQRMANSRNF